MQLAAPRLRVIGRVRGDLQYEIALGRGRLCGGRRGGRRAAALEQRQRAGAVVGTRFRLGGGLGIGLGIGLGGRLGVRPGRLRRGRRRRRGAGGRHLRLGRHHGRRHRDHRRRRWDGSVGSAGAAAPDVWPAPCADATGGATCGSLTWGWNGVLRSGTLMGILSATGTGWESSTMGSTMTAARTSAIAPASLRRARPRNSAACTSLGTAARLEDCAWSAGSLRLKTHGREFLAAPFGGRRGGLPPPCR